MATLSLSATNSTITFTVSGLLSPYVYSASADIYQGQTKVGNIWMPASEVQGSTSITRTFTGLSEGTTYTVWVYVFDSGGNTVSRTNASITTKYTLVIKRYLDDSILQPAAGTTYYISPGTTITLSRYTSTPTDATFLEYAVTINGVTAHYTAENQQITVNASTQVRAYYTTASGATVWICTGSGWVEAKPCIYDNGWVEAKPCIYPDGWN